MLNKSQEKDFRVRVSRNSGKIYFTFTAGLTFVGHEIQPTSSSYLLRAVKQRIEHKLIRRSTRRDEQKLNC